MASTLEFKPLAHSASPPSEGAPWWDGTCWGIWSHHGEASRGPLLTKVFSKVLIPQSLWPSAIARYGGSFPRSMMVNRSLGTGLGVLVEYLAERQLYEYLSWMVMRAPHGNAAHQILVAGVGSEEVLKCVTACWYLGEEDRLRLALMIDPYSELASRGLESLSEDGANLASRSLVLRRNGLVPVEGMTALKDYIKDGSLGSGTRRRIDMYDGSHGSGSLVVGEFTIATDLDLSSELTSGLGDGTTTMSLRAWMLFLSLAASEKNVSVEDIIKSARLLARSEGLL
jgi:hypothetical protein